MKVLKNHKRGAVGLLAAAIAAAGSLAVVGTSTASSRTSTRLAMPTSVMYGTTSVPVPASGMITVGGQSVQVLPGAKRIAIIQPPAGSTMQPADAGAVLPTGAVGEAFTFNNSDSTATTTPSTAVTPSQSSAAAAASPDGIGNAQCYLRASQPANVGPGNTGQIQGFGSTYGPLCTSYIESTLTVKLFSKNATASNGQTIQRGQNGGGGYSSYSVRVVATCRGIAAAKTANWHTQTIYNGVNVSTGQEESGYINSNHPDPLLQCN